MFLNHRTNRDSVLSAVRSLTWSIILKSADPLGAFDRAIGEVIDKLFLPLFCIVDLEASNGLIPAARELMMLRRLLIVPCVKQARSADHLGSICACSC